MRAKPNAYPLTGRAQAADRSAGKASDQEQARGMERRSVPGPERGGGGLGMARIGQVHNRCDRNGRQRGKGRHRKHARGVGAQVAAAAVGVADRLARRVVRRPFTASVVAGGLNSGMLLFELHARQ